ncbi:hypothetical protein BXQ27_20700 [Klebsiella aerogenes]|nr:hypothetical protein BXQ27_20700 [Klebsiella aerogenes]
MVFIARAAAPTFSPLAGATKIIDKRIVLLFILLRGATLRSPPFYAAKIYKFATKITKNGLSYS